MEKGNHRNKFPVHILRLGTAISTCRDQDEIVVHTSRPDTIAASTNRTRRAE